MRLKIYKAIEIILIIVLVIVLATDMIFMYIIGADYNEKKAEKTETKTSYLSLAQISLIPQFTFAPAASTTTATTAPHATTTEVATTTKATTTTTKRTTTTKAKQKTTTTAITTTKTTTTTTAKTDTANLYGFSQSDIDLLACLVFGEVGNQSDECQRAVASVVINRINSSEFPNTCRGVIYQKSQFTGGKSKMSDDSYRNALYVLQNGSTLPSWVMYFRMSYHFNWSGYAPYKKIGSECFGGFC